ncbi:RHS repeat-associated core domain-containing protein, partial [Xenorhabdus sp. GDc328]|uniref:RHS repeat-associated core domain-containing protein n=2 Tax=Xenorhabdus TaxID=626 RepID=UPI0006AA3EBD
KIQTQYAVCAPTGEPLALFDAAGHRVWRQPPQSLYGRRLSVPGENAALDPGLQFAGQFLDEESGLVYNRHRYFSPVASCYLTPDPLGLAGGFNPYSYVHNPTGFIDPLGLAGCSLTKVNARDHDYVLKLTGSVYPQTFRHIDEAIKAGHPYIVTIQRETAKLNRKLSLKDVKTKKGADRDEWPMAMFKEGGHGASVRYIDPSDNRGAGSSIGKILSELPDGTKIRVEVLW